jgi:ABC-type polar amino acid transport system ATPase subunit
MITTHNLHKKHGATEILKGIDFECSKGEVAAIIGPSGGGKSTFLRCINGLERFHQGEIRIGDHLLTSDTHPRKDAGLLCDVRRTVGMVFQQFNLFPHLTVIGNLIESPVQVLKEPRDLAIVRAKDLLDRMGLKPRQEAYPKDLSGGQQQRVAIARCMMMKPAAILFDEPTSALDPVMAGEVLGVMADLAKGGQTMLVVTHSMSFARGIATHVHVFAEGHDVEHGPPERLFGDPQHAITKSFLVDAQKG